jgi:hypothetical protein
VGVWADSEDPARSDVDAIAASRDLMVKVILSFFPVEV